MMKRYGFILGAVAAFLLLLFFLAEALHVSILIDPRPWMEHGGPLAAVLGVGLLTADTILPIPSSLIMVVHGALFGVLFGTLFSVLGCLGAALTGFALGRRGGPLIRRIVRPEEQSRVNRLFTRWGALAIVLTRPLPIIADLVVLLAGTSALTWRRAAAASLIGALPPSFLYALAGATATRFESYGLMIGLILAMSGLFWLISRWIEGRLT